MSNYFNPRTLPLYPVTPIKELERHERRHPKKDQKELVASINVSIKADNEADYNQAIRDTFERVLSEAEAHKAREAY
jgi:hypothetical protein